MNYNNNGDYFKMYYLDPVYHKGYEDGFRDMKNRFTKFLANNIDPFCESTGTIRTSRENQ